MCEINTTTTTTTTQGDKFGLWPNEIVCTTQYICNLFCIGSINSSEIIVIISGDQYPIPEWDLNLGPMVT